MGSGGEALNVAGFQDLAKMTSKVQAFWDVMLRLVTVLTAIPAVCVSETLPIRLGALQLQHNAISRIKSPLSLNYEPQDSSR